MTLFSQIGDYIGDKLFINFFGFSAGSSVMFIIIMYALVVAIGLKLKMSLEAMMLGIGITTAIGGGFVAQGVPVLGLFMIIAGIITALGFMHLMRR